MVVAEANLAEPEKKAQAPDAVKQALAKAEVLFSLPNRPEFLKSAEALEPALRKCGDPEKAAEAIVEMGKGLIEGERLKFYEGSAGRIADAVSPVPERQEAILKAILAAGEGIPVVKGENAAAKKPDYWIGVAPVAAGFLSTCPAEVFNEVSRAAETSPALGNAALMSIYRSDSHPAALMDGELRNLALSELGRQPRGGVRMAVELLSLCADSNAGMFKEKKDVIMRASKAQDIACAYITMIGSREHFKARALEIAMHEEAKVANYLSDVVAWLECFEDRELSFDGTHARFSERKRMHVPILEQLEEIALVKFAPKVGLKPQAVKDLTEHPELLREFIKVFSATSSENRADIAEILRACSKGKNPQPLRESEQAFKKFIKDKGFAINPNWSMEDYSAVLSCFDEEKRRDFIMYRNDVAAVSSVVELLRLRNSLAARTGGALELRPLPDPGEEAHELVWKIFEGLEADAADAAAKGLLKEESGEGLASDAADAAAKGPPKKKFVLPSAEQVQSLGTERIANRLRKALKLRSDEAKEMGGAFKVPAVRSVYDLNRPEQFVPLAAAIAEELEDMQEFAAAGLQKAPEDPMLLEIAMVAAAMEKELKAASAPDSGLLKAEEPLKFKVVDRLKKPIDFLMLGCCRRSCISLDMIDNARAEREGKKLGFVPYERAMIDYYMDWGTAGIMVLADAWFGTGKPVGHMIGHADYDGPLAVLGCNGFYLDEKYRKEGNYLNAVRFNLAFAKKMGFDEYRHSRTELQDLESKSFLKHFRPVGDLPTQVTIKDDLFFEWREYGPTWKIPSIVTKPPKFIADFFMDDSIPGEMLENLHCRKRPYLAVRFREDAEKERGKDPFLVLMRNEEVSFSKAVEDAKTKRDVLGRKKYADFIIGKGEQADFDMDSLLLRTFRLRRAIGEALISATEENLPQDRKHMAKMIVESFMAGRLIQWNMIETNALLNALSSGPYFIGNEAAMVPAARWFERHFPKSITGSTSPPSLAGLKVAVAKGGAPVELKPGSAEISELAAAIAERLPEERKGAAPRIADNLCKGRLVQWSRTETNALLNAVVSGNIFSYRGEPVSLKWLVERSYFGKPIQDDLKVRACNAEECEKLIAEAYGQFASAGEIDREKLGLKEFAASYADRKLALLPSPGGIILVLNLERADELKFCEVLLDSLHGIGHMPLRTMHLPDVPLGKHTVAEVLSEAFSYHITLCALESANNLYPGSGFDLLHDVYLTTVVDMLPAESQTDKSLIVETVNPQTGKAQFVQYALSPRTAFLLARALKRSLDKKTFRDEVLPEIFGEVANEKEELKDVVKKHLLPKDSAIVLRLRSAEEGEPPPDEDEAGEEDYYDKGEPGNE